MSILNVIDFPLPSSTKVPDMHALIMLSNTPWVEITADLGAASTPEKNDARFIAFPSPPCKVPDVDALMIFSDTSWVDVANDPGAPPRILEIVN